MLGSLPNSNNNNIIKGRRILEKWRQAVSVWRLLLVFLFFIPNIIKLKRVFTRLIIIESEIPYFSIIIIPFDILPVPSFLSFFFSPLSLVSGFFFLI